MEEMTVTGVTDAIAARIKGWGLIGRYVLVPGAVDKVSCYLQLVPLTMTDMVNTFLDDNGQQAVSTNCPDIPAILFKGKQAGVGPTGLADLVPNADALVPDSGYGVLPILLSTGGELQQYPSSAALKRETFLLLRSVILPRELRAKDWEAEFTRTPFPDPPTPEVMWPAPDDTLQRVTDGE